MMPFLGDRRAELFVSCPMTRGTHVWVYHSGPLTVAVLRKLRAFIDLAVEFAEADEAETTLHVPVSSPPDQEQP
jgi:hypothetical protein